MTVSEAPSGVARNPTGEPEAKTSLPSVSTLISSSYNFLKAPPHASVLFGFAGWLFIPVLLSLGATFLDPNIGDVLDLISGILLFGLSLWATAAIIIVVTGLVRPDLAPKDAVTSVSELAWRRAGTLLWVGVLTGLLQFFGFLLLIIPGILFTVWFAFAEVEAVLSGAGTFSSLEQSRERTRGHFWAVLWRLLAFSVLIVVSLSVILMPFLILGGITDPLVIITAPPAWLNALLSGIEILLMPLILTYELHLYFSLRKQ